MIEKPPGYAVGRGKPPLHSRFRKGSSGNPAGGRCRDQRLAALLDAALDEAVAPPATGSRRITRRQAIVAGLVEKSAAGDLRATKLLLDLVHKTNLPPAPNREAAKTTRARA